MGHDADEGDVDEGFVVAGVLLVVAGEAALFHQPAEAALDDPAPWQHDEALLIFKLFDDAQSEACAMSEELARAAHEGFEFACVAAVGEDHQQAQQAVAEHAEQQLGTIAVLHAGGCDHHAEQQAVGVGERVAFAALDLFARIVTGAQSR